MRLIYDFEKRTHFWVRFFVDLNFDLVPFSLSANG